MESVTQLGLGIEVEPSRRCTQCRQHKPLAEFHTDNHNVFGTQAKCKDCRSVNRRHHYINGGHIQHRNNHLLKAYGIDEQRYQIMLTEQGGVCAICGQTEKGIDPRNGKPRSLAVDHHHASGRVRSLLCHRCNSGIGSFKENIDVMVKAIAYISEHSR